MPQKEAIEALYTRIEACINEIERTLGITGDKRFISATSLFREINIEDKLFDDDSGAVYSIKLLLISWYESILDLRALIIRVNTFLSGEIYNQILKIEEIDTNTEMTDIE